ncbi:MAG: LrgB family protein [Rhodospirillaceae bacterium]|nr:LrgB family protein [Rhodospirillaceae bacterium]
MNELVDIWVYLASSPLLWLTATLLAYGVGQWCMERSGHHPAVNPVGIAALLLVGVLLLSDTSYQAYFDGAQFVHFLLGPAIVALAVPLARHLPKIRASLIPTLAALLVGAVTAAVSAMGVAILLGASPAVTLSMAPKSATSPIAMGISEQIGGLPSLTAALVVTTGILGAVVVAPLLNLLRIRDWRARGFAVGTISHGVGTARAFQVHAVAGVFAATALCLNALVTPVLVPLIVAAFGNLIG